MLWSSCELSYSKQGLETYYHQLRCLIIEAE